MASLHTIGRILQTTAQARGYRASDEVQNDKVTAFLDGKSICMTQEQCNDDNETIIDTMERLFYDFPRKP